MEYEKLEGMHKAGEHIGQDLLNAMIDEFKAAPDVWQKMNQNLQGDVLCRLKNRIANVVRDAVVIIASQDRPSIEAHVKSVKFGDAGIEGQLIIGKKNNERHHFADSQGEKVLVIVTNVDEYTQTMDEVKPESDQREIF